MLFGSHESKVARTYFLIAALSYISVVWVVVIKTLSKDRLCVPKKKTALFALSDASSCPYRTSFALHRILL